MPLRMPLAIAAALAIAAGAVYERTAARDIVLGDTPELTGVAITLGVAHPPGYPIWTVLGHLFTLLPVGPLPYRVALLSVVCHALTVGVVFLIAHRLTRSMAAAAVAALALAFSTLFWTWSLVGEVFPLNDLLVSLGMLLLLAWHERPERTRLLIAAAVVGGLGLANHQTIVLLGPAALYLLWIHRPLLARRPAVLGRAIVVLVLAAIVPYLYLPLAASQRPAWSWGDISSVRDLIGHILRQSYGSGQLVSAGILAGGPLPPRLGSYVSSFPQLSAALVIVGALAAYRSSRAILWFFAIAAVFAGPVFVLYANANVTIDIARVVMERFYLMSQVVVAPLAAFAVVWLARSVNRANRAISRPVAERAIAAAGIAAAIALAVLSYGRIDQSGNRVARTFAEDILASLEPGSVMLAGGDAIVMPVGYLQTIEGARRDVTMVVIPFLPAEWYVRELRREHRELVLPYDKFGPPPATMLSLIDANRGKKILKAGDLLDDSTSGHYWVYTRGVVEELRTLDQTVNLRTMTDENERILATYRIPRVEDVRYKGWDRIVLGDYAMPAYRVGHEYEIAKLYTDARAWYERALSIDPDLSEAKEGLARLPR